MYPFFVFIMLMFFKANGIGADKAKNCATYRYDSAQDKV